MFIAIVMISIVASSAHQLSISLIGSIAALITAAFVYFINKFYIYKLFFIGFHLLPIALILIFQSREIIVIAIILVFLRETLRLCKIQGENESRTSLLSNLGVIKPERKILQVLNCSLPFIVASFLLALPSVFFSVFSSALAYCSLFLFAICFGALIINEH